MFYVQPIYVQAASGSGSFPQNKITVAVYGTTVAWGDTLGQAVTGLFGEGDAADEPDRAGRHRPRPRARSAAQLAAALTEIEDAYTAGQAALKAGDFAAYGEAQKRLDAAIKRAQALAPQLLAATPSPSPSPTGSATPSPSSSTTADRPAGRRRPGGPRFGLTRVGHVRSSHTEHGFFEAVTHSTRGGAAR